MTDENSGENVKNSDDLAEEDLKGRLELMSNVNKLAGIKPDGAAALISQSNAIAQNVLRQDMGIFGAPPTTYNFDDGTKNRLIAHARQDAASAKVSSDYALEGIQKLQTSVRRLSWIVVGMFILLICIIFSGRN
ncbi:hypothetical protein OAS67_06485 [Alphaproteobacteria bacterium]|nr:hypothetical protein [Alphaproteobacteria bacterium]